MDTKTANNLNTLNQLEHKLLSPREAARWLGVDIHTLRQWRHRAKELPFVRFSARSIVYPLIPVIAAALARNAHRSPPPATR